ncbi:MAG TPA: hypothetical protein PK079_10305 [Leptospiraceae bacterium]|nr:hypothetical protein [Leptospiraceae bacterium]HMX30687.1 hypothetical protein [Leptospiraceae bacterium]HMY31846.1 hypothetical protein [Leptospiraceae bacterium]HMZ64962.1 hypothetical protein [Leptospiraceae bacterium]HNA09790.1 hypothetical protein [Leptospiraceae bacterium]
MFRPKEETLSCVPPYAGAGFATEQIGGIAATAKRYRAISLS